MYRFIVIGYWNLSLRCVPMLIWEVWELESPQRLLWQAYAHQFSLWKTLILGLGRALENHSIHLPRILSRGCFDRSICPLRPVVNPSETLYMLCPRVFRPVQMSRSTGHKPPCMYTPYTTQHSALLHVNSLPFTILLKSLM